MSADSTSDHDLRSNNDLYCNKAEYFAWNLISSIICITFLFLLIIAWYKFFSNLYLHKYPMSKTSLIAAIILMTSSILLVCVVFYYFFSCAFNLPSGFAFINTNVGITFTIQGNSVLSIFLSRLHNVFKDTSYGYNKKTLVCLISTCVTASIMGVFGIIFIAIFGDNSNWALGFGLIAISRMYKIIYAGMFLVLFGEQYANKKIKASDKKQPQCNMRCRTI